MDIDNNNSHVIVSASGQAEAYLATEIVTAPPDKLAQLLYDAAIRLCRRGLEAMDDGNAELAESRVDHGRAIIARLERITLHGNRKWADHYRRIELSLDSPGTCPSRQAIVETIEMLVERRQEWAESLSQIQYCDASASREGMSWLA